MRVCDFMAGRTDVESALPTCGAVAMALLSIVIVGVKYAVIVDWIRNILRLGIVVRLNGVKLRCKMVVDEPDFEQSPPFCHYSLSRDQMIQEPISTFMK